jgi:putative oxidoreductase
MLIRFFATDRSWVSLVQRIVLALVIFPHGAQKLFGWWGGYGYAGTVQGFESGMGVPEPVTVLIILAETLGSVALLLGAVTRPAAFGIGGVMLGAMLLVHVRVGFFMNWTGNQAGEGFEYHLLALALAIPLVIKGGGLWSVDAAIARALSRRRPRAPEPRLAPAA